MDALVIECSWTTNGIMVWAWMLLPPYALGTRTLLWFRHGCSGQCMLLEHERFYGLDMDALTPYALGTRMWKLAEKHANMRMDRNAACASDFCCCARTYGLGMDALVTVCSWNTNVIMVSAWMLWSSDSLKNERHYGLGMDAIVTVCSWNPNGTLVWAWMLWSAYALGTRTLSWFGHGCTGHRTH